MKDDEKWILLTKYRGEYAAGETITDLPAFLDGLEYEDVKEENYRLLHHPSNKLYTIRPDRELSEKDNIYATPYGKHGVVWLPKLIEIEPDSK